MMMLTAAIWISLTITPSPSAGYLFMWRNINTHLLTCKNSSGEMWLAREGLSGQWNCSKEPR